MSIDPLSLRIGFLAGTLGRGGAERQLVHILRALKNEGINSKVLCLTKGEAFEKEILDLGISVDWVGSSKNKFARLISIIGNLRRNPVDVIQSAHFYTNIYAALAGRALDITSIGAIRNDLTSEISANGVFGRWNLKLPKRLLANSQLAVDRAIAARIDPSRIYLVRNAVDVNCKGRHVTDGTGVTLLFAGRLVPQKRPELFIELASELIGMHPRSKLKFIIAGDGPQRASLEQKAREKGLGINEVSFRGEEACMSEVFQQSDILVLTSKHEGTPNVVLEAMANGLAVVATRVGGVSEIVDEDRGLVVDPHDFSELVDATSTLIADQGRTHQMGINGQTYVRRNHSISSLQNELTNVYSGIF